MTIARVPKLHTHIMAQLSSQKNLLRWCSEQIPSAAELHRYTMIHFRDGEMDSVAL